LPQAAPTSPATAKAPASTAKEPAKGPRKPVRRTLDAKIYACSDDAFELNVNGVPIMDGKENQLFTSGAALAAGDVIAVKASNLEGSVGFCCVIKFSNGQAITTSDGWKAYSPANPGQWSMPKQMRDIGPVIEGDSEWPPSATVKRAAKIDADQIWAPGKESVCYLFFVVGKLDVPKKATAD
jgi:hypothetical protein